MMTSEQFVFWLSGYLSASDLECGLTPAKIKHIAETIKNVVNPELKNQTIFYADLQEMA